MTGMMKDRSYRAGTERSPGLLRQGKGGPAESPRISNPGRCGNELAAGTPACAALPNDLREFLIDKLAEMLVLDFQANQAVSGPTVETGRLLDRRKKVAADRQL